MDEATSALSNGVPLPGMDVRIVGDAGSDLPIGERGEILVKGPCVTPGYWRNPAETANAIPTAGSRPATSACSTTPGFAGPLHEIPGIPGNSVGSRGFR